MNTPKRNELFDHWAADYDPAVQADGGFPFDGYERVLNEVVRAASAQAEMSILDVGTGTGNLAARFVHLGCDVWGVDFSAQMLARAQAKLPKVRLIQADLSAGWPNELPQRFDRIVSAYVLHEFDLGRKVAHLAQWAGHLLDGGSIAVGDISFETVEAREAARTRCWDVDEHYWAADETIQACEHAGLTVAYEQISSCGGVFVFNRCSEIVTT